MLKYMLRFATIPASEFICVTTKQTIDALKTVTVVHTVNMKFTKLKKNNVRNTDKLDSLYKTVRAWAFTQACSIGLENIKIYGNKTSTGC